MSLLNQHRPKYPVQVLNKSLEILEYLAGEKSPKGCGISEISTALQIGKSTVHRILDTLISFNYVEKCSDTGRYRLGWELFKIGHVVPKQHNFDGIDFKILEEICNQFHETTNLGVKNEKDLVVIAKYEPERNLKAIYQLGGREPLHATAMGKVLLSETSEEDLRALFKDYDFKRYTVNTIIHLESYLKELSAVRERGYAIDNEEFSIGICCLAVPVRNFKGEIAAAISVSAPSIRMDAYIQDQIINSMKKAGEKLSQYLGYQRI